MADNKEKINSDPAVVEVDEKPRHQTRGKELRRRKREDTLPPSQRAKSHEPEDGSSEDDELRATRPAETSYPFSWAEVEAIRAICEEKKQEPKNNLMSVAVCALGALGLGRAALDQGVLDQVKNFFWEVCSLPRD